MNSAGGSNVVPRFVEYIGELGGRWGLPAEACRVHALLYVLARPVSEVEIVEVLSLERAAFTEALGFLTEYRLVQRAGASAWRTGTDPWELLISGLEQRRRHELPYALELLRECSAEARAETSANGAVARQVGKMLKLVEDLAALDPHMKRLSPRLLGRIVGVSGRAARLADRVLGGGRGRPP